ncbi:MAG: hypothetical protein Q9184_005234 [Pyrenodesmia sp. 2 TL-2023]
MDRWFSTAPSDSPGQGLERRSSKRSLGRSNLDRRSSASSFTPELAQDTPSQRHRNIVRHPDSAVNSSGPFSRAARRWSKRSSAAPDTPLQSMNTQQSARSISPDEPPAQLQIPTLRFAISPETPLNHDADSATDTATSQKQSPSTASPFSGRRLRTSMSMTGRTVFPGFSGQYYTEESQANDPFTTSMAHTSFHSHKAPYRDFNAFGIGDTDVTDTDSSHLAWIGHKEPSATAQMPRVDRRKVQKPRLVGKMLFDRQSRRLRAGDDDTASADKEAQSAVAIKDPPLFDNLKDRMLQMAVDLWLLRSEIAYSLEDWNAMESHGHQAHDLADHLKWEPFVAKCAMPIGIARYKQGDWLGAYEYFQEAERTAGYYIPLSEISKWRTLTDERLGPSVAASLYSMSSEPGEERAPFITPLGSVVEEKDEFLWASIKHDGPATGDSPTSQYSMDEPELSAEGGGGGVPLSSGAPGGHSLQAPLRKLSHVKVVPRNSSTTDDGSSTDQIVRLPSRPARLPARLPAAIKLSSNAAPAGIRSLRLYDPGPHPVASPPLRTATPPLRIALQMAQNSRSGLNEMELSSPLKQASREPSDSADSASDHNGVPLDPSSSESVRLRTETTDPLPAPPSSSVSPFSIPYELPTIAERPTVTNEVPHPSVTRSRHFPSPKSYPRRVPQPEHYRKRTTRPPPQATSPDMARRWHQKKLKDARIEAEIAKVKNIASPRVRSARSASYVASPRASVLHSPPPPPQPGSSPRQRPPIKRQSIYFRPTIRRAMTDRNAYGGVGPPSVRPESWMPMGGPHPLTQGSYPGAERNRTAPDGPPGLRRRITFADELGGGRDAGGNEKEHGQAENKNMRKDVKDSDADSGNMVEGGRAEREERREVCEDKSSEEGGGVSIEDGKRSDGYKW